MSNSGGFSSLEALLSVSIIGVVASALIGALISGQQSTQMAGQRERAVFLALEGLEATRNIRNNAFTNLADGTFGLVITGSNQWAFSSSPDTVDGIYQRQIVISTSGANRKQIESTVTWQQNPQRAGTVTLTTQMTDWKTF